MRPKQYRLAARIAASTTLLLTAGCAGIGNSPSTAQVVSPTPVVIVVTATTVQPTQTPYVIVVTATPGTSTVAETTTAVSNTTTIFAADPTATASPVVTATVFNGGNVRSIPSLQGSEVRDQINAGETVTLRERTADGQWYAIVNVRGKEGWVHVSLLRLSGVAIDNVPISAEAAAAVATPLPQTPTVAPTDVPTPAPTDIPTPTATEPPAATPTVAPTATSPAASLVAAPEHVEHRMTINLSGEGWPAQTQLALAAGPQGKDASLDLGTVTAGSDGRWVKQVQLNAGSDGQTLPAGQYRIVASTFAGDVVASTEIELLP